MSRHPDNPWWHQELDIPIMIQTQLEWDEAVEGGFVLPEHVMQRLKNIADHAFNNETVAGFDEDGFVVSLTAEGLAIADGVKLYVYPNDHPPPHVHVQVRAMPKLRLRVDLTTGNFMDDQPRGIPAKKMRGFQQAIRENHDVLAGWWRDYHGAPVVL